MENENLSDFLKVAYKYNKIKNIEEAFKEFPVEEEWHKGEVENLLNEEAQNYYIDYNIGDIVFVKEYTYSDGKTGKNHLFVIIDKDNTAVPIENFGMLISSNLNKLKFNSNRLLQKDNVNNLHKDSIVKMDVLYKIRNEQILFSIGKVDDEKIEEYKKSFYELLQNENE